MKRILPVYFSLVALASTAQNTVLGSGWVRYYNQSRISDKTLLSLHVDERFLVNPVRQFQFFVHAHVNHQIRPWLDFGIGGNFNLSNSSTKNPALKIPEWRPWQEINLIKGFRKKWQLQFRYRLDERFIHENDGAQLTDGYRFNLRHRLRLQITYTVTPKSMSKPLILKLSDEVMFNSHHVPNAFDQNRIYGAVEFPLAKRWSIEPGYLLQKQSHARDDFFTERHILRVSLYHKIDWRKG